MSVLNNTDNNLDEFIGIVEKFLPFAKEQLEINEMPSIELISDSQNAADLLGKTAYYDPSTQKVVVYTDNRHAKDMLRSISHELVHHAQNQSGMFEGQLMNGDDYAQTNPHLREMEEDANLRGCMCVRDFVDQKVHLEETNSKRRVNSMKITEKELRTTIRNLIKENMADKEIPYSRDEGTVSRDAGDSSPLRPDEIRAFLEASGHGGEDLHRYKWKPEEGHERAVETAPEEEEAPPADIAADLEADKPAEESDEALEEEIVEVNDEVLNEARRRRQRRAARAAKRAATAVPTPAAPEPKAEPVKAAPAAKKKVEPKKEVIAKKSPEPEKKDVKEWYGEELFGKLLKEAIK